MPDALDHRGVVCRIGEDDTVGNFSGQCGKSSLICDVARGEEQRSLLAMEIGKLAFQKHVVMASPGNVACSACAGSNSIECLVHRCEHRRMLTHPEVIIGTPHSHLIL